MNLFFSAAAVALCTAAGMYFSKRLKEREGTLCAALLFVKELTVLIRYTNSRIGDVLRAASSNAAYGKLIFITDCSSVCENGDFHRLWNEGVKKQPFLNQRDKELLLSLGERLGETDADGQLSFLEMTEAMLTVQRDEAREDRVKKSRMYRSVGLLCGLALGITVL
ncbi:MAG: stage III sporulation protein AB [Bacteroides sp.]|nr:stage III sporulation protein AB [Bacteroides sp.]